MARRLKPSQFITFTADNAPVTGEQSCLGSHDEFDFQFIVGLCARPEKAYGEKSTRRGYPGIPS